MARNPSRSSYRATGFSRGHMSTGRAVQQLRELGEHVVEAAKHALKLGVYRVVADAKSRCPVKTGKLRDSIKAEPNSQETEYQISANAENDGVFYGPIVEFSPEINKPFMYPALDAHKQEIKESIQNAIHEASRRAAR